MVAPLKNDYYIIAAVDFFFIRSFADAAATSVQWER